MSVARRGHGPVASVRCEILAPTGRTAGLLEAAGAAVAEGAAWLGLTVGVVGIVPGDEPLLLALAPKRDVVASRFREALASGTHRLPMLWLALTRGTYLASVVDPYEAFAGSEADALAIVGAGQARHALRCSLTVDADGARLALELYGSRADLRSLLSLGRRLLAALPGWVRTSQAAPAAPSTTLKPRLSR